MKIVKQSASIMQRINFATIKEMDDWIVVTFPIECSLEIGGNFIHVRHKKDEKKIKHNDTVKKEVKN